MNPDVAIITPTYNRDTKTVLRCIKSVQAQTYARVAHYICHDGPWTMNKDLENLQSSYSMINWGHTKTRTNTYGAGVRQYVLDRLPESIKYVAHLDDDNIIFPDFVEEHVSALETNPEVGFSICKILHNGPLPHHLGNPPQIISGIPPVMMNIDTLQAMVRADAMRACGWFQYTGIEGYRNDGHTYQKLGQMFPWVELPKLLAIHI